MAKREMNEGGWGSRSKQKAEGHRSEEEEIVIGMLFR
jgi:hypothetical protein